MIICTVSGWFFTLLFSVLLVSMLMLHKWVSAFILLAIILLIIPASSRVINGRTRVPWLPYIKAAAVVILVFIFTRTFLPGDSPSIYSSPETESRFKEIYRDKMKEWPVPYEDIYIDTDYGKIHVIKSGESTSPAMVLLHAAGVASWSWKYNVEKLSERFCIYAVDTIGDAGLSSYRDLKHILQTKEELAYLYRDIINKLDIESAIVTGASEGGFIGTNLVLCCPERVRKLILIGPMGFSGAGKAVTRIALSQLFPLKSIQKSTIRWAFGDSPELNSDFGEWFTLLMNGTAPKKIAPLPFSAGERHSLEVPVLFIFGRNDNLVGDPDKAAAQVRDIPDVTVRIVEAGHLAAAEKSGEVSSMILEFTELEASD